MPKDETDVMPQVGTRPTRILRYPETIDRVKKSRSSIERACRQKTFPQKIKIGARAVGFYEADVEAYLAGLRDKGEA